jgi:uncharacterized DUF497 family protein
MEFEWDPEKAEQNLKKHGISFDEASTTFEDPLANVYLDPDHSESECRYVMVGMSSSGKTIVISFVERDDRVRIMSARVATRKERRTYEEES